MANGSRYESVTLSTIFTSCTECSCAELENISNLTKPHFAYHDNTPESAIEALGALDRYLASERPFDGILAFSQGAGLALIYTRYFHHLYPDRPLPFGCLLLFSPLGLSDPVVWLQTGELRKLVGTDQPLSLSMAVIFGKHDLVQVIVETEDIHTMIQAEMGCWTYVHSGGHHIPNGNPKEDLKGTVRVLRRAIAMVEIRKNGT